MSEVSLSVLDEINKKLKNIEVIPAIRDQLKKMDSKFDILEAKVDSKIKTVEKKIKVIEKAILNRDDEFEAFKKTIELVVTGFPANLIIDPQKLYKKILCMIGYSPEIGNENDAPKAKMFRMQNRGNLSVYMLRFDNINHKELFFERYLQNLRHFTYESFGIEHNSEDRIYIHQNLTKLRYDAFKLAKHYKKAKLIEAIKIRAQGNIAVKYCGGDHFEIANCTEDIKRRIATYKNSTTDTQHEESEGNKEGNK